MLEKILDAILLVLDALKEMFSALLVWLVEFIYVLVGEAVHLLFTTGATLIWLLLDGISRLMPDDMYDNVSATFVYLKYANGWLPLVEVFSLFALYYTLKVWILILKYVFKLIPGLGG